LTVKLIDKNSIALAGTCPSEDAEELFQYLLENRLAVVDWSQCEQAHTAVIQVLLASGCELKGTPAGSFLHGHIAAALRRARGQIRPFAAGLEVRNSRSRQD
jgi:hypothetical protein